MKIKDTMKLDAAVIRHLKDVSPKDVYARFLDLVKFTEDALKASDLHKKYWKGIEAMFVQSAVRNKTGAPAVGYGIEITYFATGWFVTSLYRGEEDTTPVGNGHSRIFVYWDRYKKLLN